MKVKVVVIDSGIELYHNAFKNIYISGGQVIKRENCWVKSNDIYDTSGHGTACASMIVSECPYIEIVSIGILDKYGKSNLAALEYALESLINSDVSIINMSLSFGKVIDGNLYRILRKLTKQKVTIIASMSNNGGISYPAIYDNVIGVRAGILEQEGGFWFHKGKQIQCVVDCVAPVVAVPPNTYIMIPSCNSIATARLTGIVSKFFWESKNIKVDYKNVCEWLQETAIRNEWKEENLYERFRVPENCNWFVDNKDPVLTRIFQAICRYFGRSFSDKQICNIELLTKNGPLEMKMVIPFLKYIEKIMNVEIDYLKINRYHLITVGTLAQYIRLL